MNAMLHAWDLFLQRLPTQPDVWALQEIARGEAGWTWETLGSHKILTHREQDCWRGAGILFDSTKWTLMRKRKTDRGIWTRLRRIHDDVELWVGSLYIPPSFTHCQHAEAVSKHLDDLPPTTLPVCLGADLNTGLKWFGRGRDVHAQGDGRLQNLLDKCQEKGMLLAPPRVPDRSLPTTRPRNGTTGRQIDLFITKHTREDVVSIHPQSGREIGTDHDAVILRFLLRAPPNMRRRVNTKPRQVTSHLDIGHTLDQTSLEALARTCTKPYAGQKYKDPAHVQALFRQARNNGNNHDWKAAHRARKNARQEWSHARLQAASTGDWRTLRSLKPDTMVGWETSFAENTEGDPHQAVQEHFQDFFQSHLAPLQPRTDIPTPVPDFTMEELSRAIGKGKPRKSVAGDQIGHELLQAIVDQGEGHKLLSWYNSMLHGAAFPKNWSDSIMVLLPKIACPKLAKHLRPINMSSAACKTFSRLLLGRMHGDLEQRNSWQCASAGRQPCDFIYTIMRGMMQEKEWKRGIVYTKIDVEKAYDKIDRQKLVDSLERVIGWSEIMECWHRLIMDTHAQIQSPWGTTQIAMRSGIKQGAIESPIFFLAIMQWVIAEAATSEAWQGPPCFENVPEELVGFMDDGILWAPTAKAMEEKLVSLQRALQWWGLRLNVAKCQLYFSPYSSDRRPLLVDGVELQPDTCVMTMGLPMHVHVTTAELVQALIARARKKFWSLSHILKTPGKLLARIGTLTKTVGGALLWCCGALIPDPVGIHMVNKFQATCVAWMMAVKRQEAELGVCHRIRCIRLARAMIQKGSSRWGTTWLERAWSYLGHVARGCNREFPPPSTHLCQYRDLEWWSLQQRSSCGLRHRGRFFPHLTNFERRLDAVAGQPWKQAAQDKVLWQSLTQKWIKTMDLEWSSGRQLAMTN